MDEHIIRKVKVLKGRAKDEAVKLGLDPDDLVIVTITTHPTHPLPEYHLEKIEGDPVSFLLRAMMSIPKWRFVLLDLRTLTNPLDAFCGDCGRRVLNGLKRLDDGPIMYYAKCVSCGFNLEVDVEDYEEDYYFFWKDVKLQGEKNEGGD